MDSVAKFRVWVAENAPMLQIVYQNKYVGMLYDHFASLPAKDQRRVVAGGVAGVCLMILGFLLISYLSLWSTSRKTSQSYAMVNELMQYEKERKEKGVKIAALERNALLAIPGRFRQYLVDAGRSASISARMIKVEEKASAKSSDTADGEASADAGDLQTIEGTVRLERINLAQLKGYLQSVEFGSHRLQVTGVNISNDTQIRGYMSVELNVTAHVFQTTENQ